VFHETDNKAECNDDENEDECDQTTFVRLKDLTKPLILFKFKLYCSQLPHS